MSTLNITAVVSALLLIATVMVAGQEPAIVIEVTTKHAKPGDDVTIICRVTNRGNDNVVLVKPIGGQKDPALVLNNEVLTAKYKSTGRYDFTPIPIGDDVKLYKLAISNVTAEDSGPYRCMLQGANIMDDKQFFVYHQVQELSFNNVSVDHGFSIFRMNESAKMDLDCIAKGSIPAADVKMFMGDVEITDEHTKKTDSTELACDTEKENCIKYQTNTKQALIQDFRVTHKDHNKDLKCVAKVGDLPPVEAVFKMHVPFSPKFECDANQVARLHAPNFKVTCKVLSNPGNPDFFWEFTWGGKQMKLSNNDKIDGEFRAGQTPNEDGSMVVFLEIPKVSMRHFMSFKLSSNNSIGTNTVDVNFSLDDTANAASINSISAIFVLICVFLRAHL